MSETAWEEMLRRLDFKEMEIRDSRYNAVVHLVTAANGAESFFGDATNATRKEDTKAACELDERLLRAWAPHHNHHIIDNRGGRSFESKMDELVMYVASIVGLPTVRKKSMFSRAIREDPQRYQLSVFSIEKVIKPSTERKAKTATRRSRMAFPRRIDNLACGGRWRPRPQAHANERQYRAFENGRPKHHIVNQERTILPSSRSFCISRYNSRSASKGYACFM